MNDFDLIGWIVSIGIFVGIFSMLYFLWSNFHESIYKNDLDKTKAESKKGKAGTIIAFIVIIWIIGFLLLGDINKGL
jgi:hypothetical protein